MKTILVTGGVGYIGSHTVVALQENGYKVVILDNLCNSKAITLSNIQKISSQAPIFYQGDIRDRPMLRDIFKNHPIDGVIHFAGLKAVGESQSEPLKYYDNNVVGSITLLEEMIKAKVDTFVFSSSATVYGEPGATQYQEGMPTTPINVYGRTKLMVEEILRDGAKANPGLRVACLRYFNPVGAHLSGLIGENPVGTPNNLMPYIGQIALGILPKLKVFGSDYPTPDGTGLRDYIHVHDLAQGHLLALQYLEDHPGALTVNLGTGKPYSVLEMISAFEKVSGKSIPYDLVERRSGDLAEYYANSDLAKTVLGWEAKHGIERMCEDTWRFYRQLDSAQS
ncbi:UDP-glucose 4-epimerase GalE [Polynucleobacter sp. AP-Jannik-300A-C4]|uniref:UDP-glucose 4-epimerase GalE n=1 Tax=Polynucleobacter sp. AP-Jannik-300A-C4 TaxID=2576928 RepID=UPI001BFD2BF6|nr:UDP-glucose 4-epimerase GalE [Polynucleobacter sp. AP-Jannik-300A-C4]QWE22878.1 UDP-glucose 4-epimerase GalE [Polynucleobacter sp. AP-Jannik-300A-C4]